MDAILTAVPWSGLGWGGLIFAAVLALIRGDLVPRKTHESALASRDDIIQRERVMSDRAMGALRLLATEYGTTTDKVLNALPTDEGADDGTS